MHRYWDLPPLHDREIIFWKGWLFFGAAFSFMPDHRFVEYARSGFFYAQRALGRASGLIEAVQILQTADSRQHHPAAER